jgi:hypothetical protein
MEEIDFMSSRIFGCDVICISLSQSTMSQKPRPQTSLLLLLLLFIFLFHVFFIRKHAQLIAFLASGMFALHFFEDEGDVAFTTGNLGPVSFVAAL